MAAQPATGTGEAGEGEKREHHRRARRHRDFHKPREGAPIAAAAPADGATAAEAREDKGERRARVEGKGRERDGEGRRDKFQEERRGDAIAARVLYEDLQDRSK